MCKNVILRISIYISPNPEGQFIFADILNAEAAFVQNFIYERMIVCSSNDW